MSVALMPSHSPMVEREYQLEMELTQPESQQHGVVTPGDAVLSLLSLGSLSPTPSSATAASTPSPSSSVVTACSPTPRSKVVALESRMAGGRFEFRGKENAPLDFANLPPPTPTREASFSKHSGMSAHKRTLSRTPSLTAPAVPSLAQALQSAQASQTGTPGRVRVALTTVPKSPPRKIVPTHGDGTPQLQAQPSSRTTIEERIPTPQELDAAASLLERTSSTATDATALPTPVTPQHVPLHHGYSHHLMRARSVGSTSSSFGSGGSQTSSAGCMSSLTTSSSTLSSRSLSMMSTGSSGGGGMHSVFRLNSGGSISGGSSVGCASISRVHVCVKPREQMRIHATTALASASTIRTYEFP